MMKILRGALFLAVGLMVSAGVQTVVRAQQAAVDFKQALHWRNIGPFRGGRTRAVAGVPSQPNVFYAAQVAGGIFKTTDYGRTWAPIFDDQPTGSIGALAVSISNPKVIYAGSGEGLHRPDLSVGDGVYKSTDAGQTWAHLGLRDGQQIAQIAVDPKNAERLFVAVAGHPYGPNEERGIFRSTDGGKTFEKVLYKDENTGGADVAIDPVNTNIVYASLWESREGPWENAKWDGTGGGIFKSTDGGKTWNQLQKGLPEGIIQANLTVAPSSPAHLFAAVATAAGAKLYASDDAGASWRIATDDGRPATRIGGGDLPVIRFDPKNPAVLYSASIVSWKSTDGGKTWNALKGAPGGDDYQNVWINPNNTDIILLGSDQGAVITVNGGRTWSSWYNQSTAQLYHVMADNDFPYRLCSGQQESGSVCIASRGNDGEINFRDWHPVSAEEYGYVTPDPLDANIVFGGKLTRYDRRTGQAQNILPKPFRAPDFRMVRTEPVVFSPVDPHLLFFAANTLWKTLNAGQSWEQVSPDLTRKTWEIPASVGKYMPLPTAQPSQRGVIYTVAPSPLDVNRIWAGTDDGLIHKTTDGGKNWTDVTPPQISAWQKISIIDAGHFEAGTAYAAVNTIRLDDLRPHIYRTHDDGKTWQEIVKGIPGGQTVNVVREDPERKGLLYAGTERAAYVSFDDGDNWQSLRLNMPATSVRDLIVKGDDLAVATHGRGFWILDDINALRQLDDGRQKSGLYKPQTAMRVRWNTNSDTPIPPDEPTGENPPDGAVIDYYLEKPSAAAVTLEIRDQNDRIVRRYSSADKVPEIPKDLSIPAYWVRPAQILSSGAGMHRFVWDLHYQPVPGVELGYPISAVYRNTAMEPTSPWVMPGEYKVVLTVGGKAYTRPLTVKIDPRVKTPADGLQRQFDLSKQLYDAWLQLEPINSRVQSLNEQLAARSPKANAATSPLLAAFGAKLQTLTGAGGRPGAPIDLAVLGRVRTLFGLLQEADAAPTPQISAAVLQAARDAQTVLESWEKIEKDDLPALNKELQKAGLPKLDLNEVNNRKQEFEDID